ncbi:phosphoribosyltransferase [Maribacter halichondriae]|uniref:phosphoribosyltransferase n=1 Tax=Maribacter halichondriae TaxID=2980554 RepID=UPI002358E777|nr:phosphoribosyltransferase family protein [Maribacter sp. Hal144]
MFEDRIDAGTQLADKLMKFKDENVVVLAIPRGGLPLGSIVAKALDAPLDVALSKKIGSPFNKEYAIGAVSMENIVLSDAGRVDKRYIMKETNRIRKKLKERQDQYYKNRSPKDLKDKIVVIVDDGIATGNTILVTVELVDMQKPSKIVVAVPVAPPSTMAKLKDSPLVDEVVCLQTPYNFRAVGQFYEEFYQVSDQEAIRLLEESNAASKSSL